MSFFKTRFLIWLSTDPSVGTIIQHIHRNDVYWSRNSKVFYSPIHTSHHPIHPLTYIHPSIHPFNLPSIQWINKHSIRYWHFNHQYYILVITLINTNQLLLPSVFFEVSDLHEWKEEHNKYLSFPLNLTLCKSKKVLKEKTILQVMETKYSKFSSIWRDSFILSYNITLIS